MKEVSRVAYFPDSFLEVNGVAMTSNKLVNFAKQRDYPMICVHAGPRTETRTDGSVTFVSLKRSPLAIPMDEALRYDPVFQRHVGRVKRQLKKFKPDVIHITGLNDVSIIGAYLAWKLDIPLVGSWHTNLHEYAARRLNKALTFLPEKTRHAIAGFVESKILDGAKLYYKMPQVLLAPNQDLIDMLVGGTGRKANLMIRGVDSQVFSPEKRTINDGKLRFGFVGRLRIEKNVRMLAELEKRLFEAGKDNFEFLIVGEGDERKYLQQNMKTAVLTGFLEGEQLSEAYANMDVFVFPSETDAYGNVPQEAMASGAPALVTDQGGPKFFVEPGVNGFICSSFDDFVKFSLLLMDDAELLAGMKISSREFAMTRSWESVFESVYRSYVEARDYLAAVRQRQREKATRKLANDSNT